MNFCFIVVSLGIRVDRLEFQPTAGDKGRLAISIKAALGLVLNAKPLKKTVYDAKGFHSSISGLVVDQNDANVIVEQHVLRVVLSSVPMGERRSASVSCC